MKKIHIYLLLLVLLGFVFYAPPLSAECLHPYNPDHSTDWKVNASAESHYTDLESTDLYLSGGGTDVWRAMNDVDGELYGFSINTRPPVLGKRISMDLSYLTGDLSGTFNTREISPTPVGPYYGTVKFNRDEWKLGVDVFVLNAVYGRLEYSTYEMKGDWVYSDGSPNEPQKYEFDAYSMGVGFRQNYFFAEPETDFERKVGWLVNIFCGLSSFDYKHTEQLSGASVKTNGIGYQLRAELLGTYKVNSDGKTQIFAGVGYAYKNNDDDDLDLAENVVSAKLGIRAVF